MNTSMTMSLWLKPQLPSPLFLQTTPTPPMPPTMTCKGAVSTLLLCNLACIYTKGRRWCFEKLKIENEEGGVRSDLRPLTLVLRP